MPTVVRWTRRCDERVIGIELAQLKRVPRAIAVAGGPGKTEAIRAALLGGWINCLITDTYTAERLLETGTAPEDIQAAARSEGATVA